MATYIPGIIDYIPQAQPFQPDYNFLGNMLQTKQSQYDQNYKQLSQAYGTLLNSDMLREDNIQKRNEFFKMIDDDIKRISGMDLSLQQNVDSANKVFDSFFQNKDLVKDMTFTKEYQKQMQIGESFRNCIDQEKCGGKYWDTGMQALHYRADEFKNASKQDSMSMQPGRFVPQINVQEKTVNYLKDLLGKGGDGGFGVESISFSPDGRYQVKTKNGANLSIPLQQLIQAQYSKDQNIIDMYNTQAYVNRKGFIAGNLAAFGGDADAAEDAYFRQLDVEFQKAQSNLINAQDQSNAIRARNNVLANQIKKNGSTEDDHLAKDYTASAVDLAASKGVLKDAEETHNIAKSVFEAGENRAMRRNRADQLFGRSLMNKELSEAAVRAAAMTGSVSMTADPYAMKHYEFSLDMAKMKTQYDLMDRNSMRNHLYDLNKQKALLEYKKRGSAVEPDNQGVYVDGVKGTTAIAGDNESQDARNQVMQEAATAQGSANAYTNGYANTLVGILQDPKASTDEKAVAKASLINIFGKAERNQDGSLKSSGYDIEKGVFVDKNGNTHATAQGIAGTYDWKTAYDRAQQEAKLNRSIPTHASYLDGEGKKLQDNYDTNMKVLAATSKAWYENNKNVKSWGNTKLSGDELENWNNLFTSDNNLKSPEQFAKDYLRAHPSDDESDAMDAYEEMNDKYNKFYNEGNVAGKDNDGKPVPVVRSTHGSSNFNFLGGGTSAGGGVIYNFNSESPASLGTRGLITMYQDAQKPGSIWTIGNHGDRAEGEAAMAATGTNAKLAMDQLMHDLRTGNHTKAEKENIQGQIMYMDVALGDKNMAGATIKMPTSWLQRYQKSDKNVNWADDMSLASEGVSMYVDKRTAKNAFTQSFKEQPYDYILNHDDVKISIPNAGDLTINKRNSDGSITVIGNVGGYDANGKWQLVPATKTYYGDVGGQNLYNNLNVYMNEIAASNKAYKESKVTNRIHEPGELPQIQNQLQAAANGNSADPTDMYLQSVQQALFGK